MATCDMRPLGFGMMMFLLARWVHSTCLWHIWLGRSRSNIHKHTYVCWTRIRNRTSLPSMSHVASQTEHQQQKQRVLFPAGARALRHHYNNSSCRLASEGNSDVAAGSNSRSAALTLTVERPVERLPLLVSPGTIIFGP